MFISGKIQPPISKIFGQLRLMDKIIEARDLSLQRDGVFLLKEVDWCMHAGQCWALTGPTGSGKTLFTQCLAEEVPHGGMVTKYVPGVLLRVTHQHHFRNRSNMQEHYYQQRFQSQDMEDAPTVREVLTGEGGADSERIKQLLETMRMSQALDESLLQLSNGEHKRLQLIRALLRSPGILVLDQPFTGLDTAGRALLSGILKELLQQGVSLALITGTENFPEFITHVAYFNKGQLLYAGGKESFTAIHYQESTNEISLPASLPESRKDGEDAFTHAVEMRNVTVRYGEKILLQDINWQIKRSERWLLWGPNGAGKSTLLSLIYADNPQAYANEIHLFGKRRGSGETIWDIKRRTGFVSPELHAYFGLDNTVFDVVASGLFDTIGLFRKLSGEQEERVINWLSCLELLAYRNKLLRNLSLGQQRLALLARALIKQPPLLILDEPCQGLDDVHTMRFNDLVDRICPQNQLTLIYVSHYREAIPPCIDHILALDSGRINICQPFVRQSTLL